MRAKSEIQAIAARNGWKVGPLTYAQVQRMSSTELEFHEQCNNKELTRATNERKVEAEQKTKTAASRTERMWSDQATPEETREALEEVQIFCHMFPQFRGDYVPNREALVGWLRPRNMAVTARNLITAFQSLAAEGKLILNPAAIGIGKESELTGHKLKNHPQLWRLLEPAKTVEDQAKQTIEKTSASTYLKTVLKPLAEKKLGEEIPTAALRSFDQAWLTFASLHPEYDAKSEGNREKLAAWLEEKTLDPTLSNLEKAYSALADELELNPNDVAFSATGRLLSTGDGGNASGQVSNASSLGRKIASMTAEEYSRWLQVPANRSAANAVTTGSSR